MSRTQDVEFDCFKISKMELFDQFRLGYRVYKYIDISTPTDEMKIFSAVDWEPMEVSLVSLPFDPLAQVRNAPSMYSAIVETKNQMRGNNVQEKPISGRSSKSLPLKKRKWKLPLS
jgi:hypothetical protein